MPYLRPLYDALYDMMSFDEVSALIERGVIEVAPLAFMRGRTLNNAFIILDEAQNTTVEQMLMFLTRMGFNSRCVITGDPSQSDLTGRERSGLLHAIGHAAERGGDRFRLFRHPRRRAACAAREDHPRLQRHGTGELTDVQGPA